MCLGGSDEPGAPVVLLIGDSHAAQWVAAFSDAGRSNARRLSYASPPSLTRARTSGDTGQDQRRRSAADASLTRHRPDIASQSTRQRYRAEEGGAPVPRPRPSIHSDNRAGLSRGCKSDVEPRDGCRPGHSDSDKRSKSGGQLDLTRRFARRIPVPFESMEPGSLPAATILREPLPSFRTIGLESG